MKFAIFWPYRLKTVLVLLLALRTSATTAATLLDYPYHEFSISVCRIDMRRDKLQMFWKDERKALLGKFSVLQTWLRARGETLVCATNAGIYGKDYRPIGLYVEDGVVLRKLNIRKNAYGNFYLQPNGVFAIRNHRAEIIDTDRFFIEQAVLMSDVLFATQSGPLLIRNGRINAAFSPDSSNRLVRNAVCVTSPDEVLLALSRGPVSFYEFSLFLRDQLHCRDALYLDGNISRMYPGENADLGPSFGAIIGATK